MPVSLWLSNYHQNLLSHLSRQERGSGEKERGKSLITLACSNVRSLIKPSYLAVTPSQEPPSSCYIFILSIIKYLGTFFFGLKIIQDFCLGLILRKLAAEEVTGHTRDIHSVMEKIQVKCLSSRLVQNTHACACPHTRMYQLDKCVSIAPALAS